MCLQMKIPILNIKSEGNLKINDDVFKLRQKAGWSTGKCLDVLYKGGRLELQTGYWLPQQVVWRSLMSL
jgi:hypothetical protein